jgi:protein phosphatase
VSVPIGCPTCRLSLLVPAEHLGKVVRCPGCRQTFTVRPPLPRAGGLQVGSATGTGRVRPRNEDSLLVQQLGWATQAGRHELGLAAVADGMGGHQAGDRASALAVGCVARALAPRLAGLVAGEEALPGADGVLEMLDFALWEAHRAIARVAAEEPDCAGMGATAVVALVLDGQAAVCHVGDCRAYHSRGGTMRQLTRDQTLVQRLVDLGQLSDAEAARYPSAGQVTQALGRQYDLEPSRQAVEFAPGDVLLLACDGLHGQVGEVQIAEALRHEESPRRLAERLVEQADAAGGGDNCTVVVVRGG